MDVDVDSSGEDEVLQPQIVTDLERLVEQEEYDTVERWLKINRFPRYSEFTQKLMTHVLQNRRMGKLLVEAGHLESFLLSAVEKGLLLTFKRYLQMSTIFARTAAWMKEASSCQRLVAACLAKGCSGSPLFLIGLQKRCPQVFSCPELEKHLCWYAMTFWQSSVSVLKLLKTLSPAQKWKIVKSEPTGDSLVHLFFKRCGLSTPSPGDFALLRFVFQIYQSDETVFRRNRANEYPLVYAARNRAWGLLRWVLDTPISIPAAAFFPCWQLALVDPECSYGFLVRFREVLIAACSVQGISSTLVQREATSAFLVLLAQRKLAEVDFLARAKLAMAICAPGSSFIFPSPFRIMKACGSEASLRFAETVFRDPASAVTRPGGSSGTVTLLSAVFGILHYSRKKSSFSDEEYEAFLFQRTKILKFLDVATDFGFSPAHTKCSGQLTVLDHCYELEDQGLILEVLFRGGKFSKKCFSVLLKEHRFVQDSVRDLVLKCVGKKVQHSLSLFTSLNQQMIRLTWAFLEETKLQNLQFSCCQAVA